MTNNEGEISATISNYPVIIIHAIIYLLAVILKAISFILNYIALRIFVHISNITNNFFSL